MKSFLLLAVTLLLTSVGFAQDEPAPPSEPTPSPSSPAPVPPDPAPAKPDAAPAKPGPGGRGANNAAPATPACTANTPRAYDRVILPETKTQQGIFKVHHVNTCYYWEIPASELGKDFLLEAQIARNTLGAGYGGRMVGALAVRWERKENRVFLRNLNFGITADPKSEIAKAVEAANTPAIMMVFNIEAFGEKEAPVIEISRMFIQDIPELSGRNTVRGRGMDNQRTFIDRITAYPNNIEAESTQTFTNPTDGGAGGGGGRGGPQQAMLPGSGTVSLHFSMVKLPETPMKTRLADSRVGYFSDSEIDFSRPEHRAEERTYISRWRLEKKDPEAALSEPVKPIVYYVDPATPKAWVPYVKKGIESWQSAFEAAGFKNAIIAKEAPSATEDATWSAEDARYSVVRWLPSTTQNAEGPHISDPRTGEILDADIQLYHNIMNLIRDWYFIQVSPLDPRASKLPLPDDLMGELIQFVVAHEVGHTLGLRHNMKSSSTYPVEKLRDPEWLRTMGHTPSIMDYARYNYVAQPEDKIDPKLLIPGIGPYDKFAIRWGYAPIPTAKTSDEERKTLDAWAREQDTTPWLRFAGDETTPDPGSNREAIGDADAVLATTLGLKNLERVMANLLNATTHDGEDWSDLDQVYRRVLGQWTTELNHVTSLIGGMETQTKHGGQAGVLYTPVPQERQQAAVKFLSDTAFQAPKMFLDPEILRRIEPSGALTRIRAAQLEVLSSMMAAARFNRLVEQQAIGGDKFYSPTEFLADVRRGIFGEMLQPSVKIDVFRRNLQRAYLELVSGRLNGNNRALDEQRPLLRGELQTIAANAATAVARAADRETRLHLEDLRTEIARILDPKFQLASPAQNAPLTINTGVGDEGCWVDYAAR